MRRHAYDARKSSSCKFDTDSLHTVHSLSISVSLHTLARAQEKDQVTPGSLQNSEEMEQDSARLKDVVYTTKLSLYM